MTLFRPHVIFLTLSCVLVFANATQLHPLSDAYIDLLNSKQSSWKAGRNFHPDTPIEYIKGLMGLIKDSRRDINRYETKHHDEDLIKSLPESFDPREKWPYCPSLNEIRDQGGCGSCWAISGVEAMTDRYCIHSNGTKQFHFSTEDLLTCSMVNGCSGGYITHPWDYMKKDGIVSGGPYNSNEGCRPYEIEPCEPLKPCVLVPTPKCVKSCVPSYGVDYSNDKRRGGDVESFMNEEDIKAELFTNGPIEVGFTVYADFMHYKQGVYYHIDGKELGGHAVKLMGWGVEYDMKYWLCANSWNATWGDNGFFKILRGENNCDIEEFGGVASKPIII